MNFKMNFKMDIFNPKQDKIQYRLWCFTSILIPTKQLYIILKNTGWGKQFCGLRSA